MIEEIYTALVEQFGVGVVFLPKYRKNRVKDITWLEFIEAALEISTEELYKYCGYSEATNFSRGLRQAYPHIIKEKGGRPWRLYLPTLVHKRHCCSCGRLLEYINFSPDSTKKDGLHSECKSCKLEYYKGNKNHILDRQRYYRQANTELIKERHKEYYSNNKYLFNARNAKRRATKLQATPNWANLITIKQIYETCPSGYHVDHIVPLQHDLVCGLHCEFNLQHLTAKENLSKGNKFEVD
jgi:hypothetical protein